MFTAPLPASMVSLAVRFPERVIANDYWRARYPDLVRTAEEQVLGKLWRREGNGSSARFDAAMARYVSDPFRGCVERRWLAAGESALDLEVPAALEALEAAGLGPGDVDLLICSSFFPDQCDVGNAAFLARRLGLLCPAWNLESACSSSLVALETATRLVASGAHRNVLVVTSCTYSRISPEDDTLAWGNGDGAAAFVVAPVPAPCGLLAFHSINTSITCGAIYATLECGGSGARRIQMRTRPEAGRLLRETAEPFLTACVGRALEKARLSADDIDLFVFNTPTAWYTAFCADALGVPESRSVNVHSLYANVGPVLMPANLFHAACDGRVREGATVLLYAVGSVSNASAAVVRFPRLRLRVQALEARVAVPAPEPVGQ
jgi:3-oxoacyl-[acyl-carrier-protein] synthase-3